MIYWICHRALIYTILGCGVLVALHFNSLPLLGLGALGVLWLALKGPIHSGARRPLTDVQGLQDSFPICCVDLCQLKAWAREALGFNVEALGV